MRRRYIYAPFFKKVFVFIYFLGIHVVPEYVDFAVDELVLEQEFDSSDNSWNKYDITRNIVFCLHDIITMKTSKCILNNLIPQNLFNFRMGANEHKMYCELNLYFGQGNGIGRWPWCFTTAYVSGRALLLQWCSNVNCRVHLSQRHTADFRLKQMFSFYIKAYHIKLVKTKAISGNCAK